jgi:hypothetical protein
MFSTSLHIFLRVLCQCYTATVLYCYTWTDVDSRTDRLTVGLVVDVCATSTITVESLAGASQGCLTRQRAPDLPRRSGLFDSITDWMKHDETNSSTFNVHMIIMISTRRTEVSWRSFVSQHISTVFFTRNRVRPQDGLSWEHAMFPADHFHVTRQETCAE